ncbi:MAG: hypothetical protein Q8922_04295 [Bacteroidota bacterium]|nr:hypothetical protein [Bacteroidota bacterium]MDP4231800.1 hypothetical protein [Bacteroidota bacterium]MDP4287137.1 hypothetical protein [Bacteroidota bacterium]
MKHLLLFTAVLFLIGSSVAPRATAQVPRYISYQGLINNPGGPLTGTHSVQVYFFLSADTNSASVYNVTMPAVTFSEGVFGVMIAVPDNTVFSKPIYLGLKLDNGGFIGQATAVTATPYAFYSIEAAHAKLADSALSANTARSAATAARATLADSSLHAQHAVIADSLKGGIGTISRQSIGAASSATNNDITSLSGLTSPLPVYEGGTGANAAVGARVNLGAAASGSNSDIMALNALTTPISLAQGGTGSNTAIGARTNLGLGSIATQSSGAVAITGGAMDGTTIGATNPAAATLTTLRYTNNIFTLGNENDNATNLNTVTITGTVPIAIIMTGAATNTISANVTSAAQGQWLYLINRTPYSVVLFGTTVLANAAAQFLFAGGTWVWVQ